MLFKEGFKKMEELVYSETTGRYYCPSKCVRLVNMKQMMFYMKSGVEILDFYPSKDFKTDEDILVFIVDKVRSQMTYKKWLEKKNEKK